VKTGLACLCALVLLPAVRAQCSFVVLEHGKPQLVRAVRYEAPQIGLGATLQSARGLPRALAKAPIYGPGYLQVRNVQVRSWHLELVGTATRLNYELEIKADVTPDRDLNNCFLVLELDVGKEKGLVFAEMPNLRAGHEEHLGYRFPVVQGIEEGRYHIHFFSDGPELLTSQMPPTYVEAQKRKTEEFLLRDQPDRTVTVAHALAPAYPPDLQPAGSAGSATVRCHIDRGGKLVDASLVTASHRAFGEAALAAVRQWQFGPAVRNHHYTDATVDIPFEFPPPDRPVK
jgi:TonB family protein